MNEQEARKAAELKVFVYMNRGDIEYECEKRGIRIVKNRSTMEKKLIDKLTKEYTTE